MDIVDDNNQLTGGSLPRSVVHKNGQLHRAVHIYVFRQKQSNIELLVHLRSEQKDLNPGRWDTRFGGHIRQGQTQDQAVQSEINDEIGLKIQTSDLLEGNWEKGGRHPNNEFNKLYYLEFKGDVNDLRFNDGEVQKVKWMDPLDIREAVRKEPDKWSGSLGRLELAINQLNGFLARSYLSIVNC